MYLVKSHFRGWVHVTEEQKEALVKNMISGITMFSGQKKQDYINSRFKQIGEQENEEYVQMDMFE